MFHGLWKDSVRLQHVPPPQTSLAPSFLKSLGCKSRCCTLSRDSSTHAPPACPRGSLARPPWSRVAHAWPLLPAPPALSAGGADEAVCQPFTVPHPHPYPREASLIASSLLAEVPCTLVRRNPERRRRCWEPGNSCTRAPMGHLQRPGPKPGPLGRPRLPGPRGHTPSRSPPPPTFSPLGSLLAPRLVLFLTLHSKEPHERGRILIG